MITSRHVAAGAIAVPGPLNAVSSVLQIAAVVVTAITMAPALAHALELPGKLRLGREQYLTVQRIYYPGFTWMGAAEPLAVILLVSLLAVTPAGTMPFRLVAVALTAAIATHLIYWVWTAPVNRAWLKDEKLSGTAQRFFGTAAGDANDENWIRLRDRWERSHVGRAVTASIAFVLTTVAVVH